MIFVSNKTLIAFLGSALHVSGRHQDRCPSESGSSYDNSLIDCSDLSTSIDALVADLGGSSSSATITSQVSDPAFYDDVIQQYASNTVVTSPTNVVQAMDEFDVQATVMFAGQCDYTLTVRSGGHSYLGISSCDGSELPCIQLDVRNINHIDVVELNGNQGKQLRVGAGAILEELAETFVDEGVFIPTGECTDVGIGGHQQTGGLSASWGRTFGYFVHHVESFRIVLPDGSLHLVETPKGGSTSDLNDDIFYAVLGGASGSYGTIVETTFNTHKDEDYFAQYWEVNFLFDGDTFDGIVSMFKKFAEMLEDEDFTGNSRWNIEWTIIGGKTLYTQAFAGLDVPGFNFLQLDFTYIVKTNGLNKEMAKFEAQEIYDTLLGACSGCLTLDAYFESTLPPTLVDFFKGNFQSVYGETGPISQFINGLTLFDFNSFGVSSFPYKTSWQQGPEFPDEADVEEILIAVKDLMPTFETTPSLPLDAVFVVSQWVTMPTALHAKDDIALPFQNDEYGIVLDAWDLTASEQIPGGALGSYLRDSLRQVRDLVIESTGGEDHRMFWNPDEDPCLECGDSEFYYDDEEKFTRLREIKSCVDPDNVFDGRMTMPQSDA